MNKLRITDEQLATARNVDMLALAQSYGVEMKRSGKEAFGLCPFHSEKTPSFTITPSKNLYSCQACGAGGDPVKFVQQLDYASEDEATGFKLAVLHLNGESADGFEPVTRMAAPAEPEKERYVRIVPVPDTAPPIPTHYHVRTDDGWVPIPVTLTWEYRDENGDTLGYVIRATLPDGKKHVSPLSWCVDTETGEAEWRWLSFEKPRPLYGLDRLAANPNAQVMIVEGEKSADAARQLMESISVAESRLVVVTWPGGTKAVNLVDWSPLKGRKIGVWPDADLKPYPDRHPRAGEIMLAHEQVGMIAALNICDALKDIASERKIIVPPAGVPDGWDLADEMPDGFDLRHHLTTAAASPDKIRPAKEEAPDPVDVPWDDGKPEPEQEAGEEEGEAEQEEQEQEEDTRPAVVPGPNNGYFRPLGYDHGTFYFFQYSSKQILPITLTGFTDAGLIALAPIEYWEANFHGTTSTQYNKKNAISALMGWCREAGIYDPTRIRGRGAWVDAGRAVLHLGSHLIVDGESVPVTGFQSRHVYELAISLPDLADDGLTTEEGFQLLELCERFRWSMGASAPLLLGWTALAPLCGAIRWRPHIWLSGGAGSGKSTILDEFVHPLMNDMSLFAQGNSSEAGIRQELGHDAMPVLVDEGEQNDDRERARMQSVIALIRQASSESSAKTYKGTPGGSAQSFTVRSMFCLASIQVGMDKQADKERLTVLNLRPKRDTVDASGEWADIKERLYLLRRESGVARRLFRRSLDLLPITLKNIATFAEAGADKFGSQRDGDQYGTLMAGAWSVISDDVATPELARAMLDKYDWTDYMAHMDHDESTSALAALMEARIRVSGGNEFCVYELVQAASSGSPQGVVDQSESMAILQRYGMRITGDRLALANQSLSLTSLVQKTPYATDLRGVLKRLPGAGNNHNKGMHIGGSTTKVVTIPLSMCVAQEDMFEPPV